MALVQKMMNPTPFDVKIPYERGVYINVPADGESSLTMQQFEDFSPGKPGSEATRKILEMEGCFIADSDLSYDYQALQALQSAIRERRDRIKTFMDRTRNSRNQNGAPTDDDTMNEIKESAGYGKMERNVEKLEARARVLSEILNRDETKKAAKSPLDPERTCFVINPPKQFASKAALWMYLEENPDIKEKHRQYLKAAAGEETEGDDE